MREISRIAVVLPTPGRPSRRTERPHGEPHPGMASRAQKLTLVLVG